MVGVGRAGCGEVFCEEARYCSTRARRECDAGASPRPGGKPSGLGLRPDGVGAVLGDKGVSPSLKPEHRGVSFAGARGFRRSTIESIGHTERQRVAGVMRRMSCARSGSTARGEGAEKCEWFRKSLGSLLAMPDTQLLASCQENDEVAT